MSIVDDKKLHFFAFAFQANMGGRTATATHDMGCFDQLITRQRIDKAKVEVGVPPDSCLLGISYLGDMSLSEFNGNA